MMYCTMSACQFIEQLILLKNNNSACDMTQLIRLYYTLPNEPCSFTSQRGHTRGIGHSGANAMTKLLTFHSSMLSPERTDMSDRLISDLDAHIAHLSYTVQELKKEV